MIGAQGAARRGVGGVGGEAAVHGGNRLGGGDGAAAVGVAALGGVADEISIDGPNGAGGGDGPAVSGLCLVALEQAVGEMPRPDAFHRAAIANSRIGDESGVREPDTVANHAAAQDRGGVGQKLRARDGERRPAAIDAAAPAAGADRVALEAAAQQAATATLRGQAAAGIGRGVADEAGAGQGD